MSTTWAYPETMTAPSAEATDVVTDATQRQNSAVIGVLRRTDPQTWLFAERARYLQTGRCDPFAEQLLRQAGFLRG
ncbi:MAG: hypothetical protein Q4G43_14275 [Mobilicoccus sp.]|nr:hypothetical protein [Mobilicoccus sp.]